MKCDICDRETNDPPIGDDHHLNRSPVAPDLCLGCWVGWLEFEKFLMRAGRPPRLSIFSKNVMRQMLKLYDEGKL